MPKVDYQNSMLACRYGNGRMKTYEIALSCRVCCCVASPLFFDALHNVVSHVEDAACWRFAHSTPPSTSLLRIPFKRTLLAEVVLASRHHWVLRGGTYTVLACCRAIEA